MTTASRSAPPLNYTFTLAGAQISGANSFDSLVAGTAPILAQANAQIGGFVRAKTTAVITESHLYSRDTVAAVAVRIGCPRRRPRTGRWCAM